MSSSSDRFARIEPQLIRRENGGWLAVTPIDAPVPIGVTAWSADEARNQFVRALREWAALLDTQTQDATNFV